MSRKQPKTPEAAEVQASGKVEEAFSEAFGRLLGARRDEPAWMRRRREEAWEEFASLPMPTANDESWRRTDIRSLELEPFAGLLGERGSYAPVDAKPRGAALPIPRGRATENVVVHAGGASIYARMDEDLVRRGVIFTDLDTAARRHQDLLEPYYLNGKIPDGAKKFAALHGAFCTGGTFLYVPDGVVIDVPLQSVVHFRRGQVADSSHTLVVAGENSQVTFIEELASANGGGPGLHVGGIEIYLDAGANVRFGHIQAWGAGVCNFASHRACIGRDSHLQWVSGLWGSRLSKVFQEVELRDRGGRAEMLGLLLGRGRQHLDYETFQDHQAPDCTSDLLYKGTFTDRARSVWRGMIRVAPGANGTDAYQVNNNLLLDKRARADSIPGLEIEANEVRCTHAATAGQIDKEQLFYLQSRGVPAPVARQIVVEGFFEALFQRMEAEPIERRLRKAVDAALAAQ
jgi:Fe-S cluster assembly protein SufD